MPLTIQEQQINNSYQIKQEFKQHNKSYHCPSYKKAYCACGRSNKPRIFSPEEIFMYKLKTYGHIVNCEV